LFFIGCEKTLFAENKKITIRHQFMKTLLVAAAKTFPEHFSALN